MNLYAIKAIYLFELARTWRTLLQSIATPVISTSLYFVVFGSAIGSSMTEVHGVSYGAFIVPGLIMLALLTESIGNASFGIYMPKYSGTIYEILSAPVSYFEILVGYVGAAATKSVILGLIIFFTSMLFVDFELAHPFWALALLVLTAITFCLFGFIFITTQWFQALRGYTALQTAVATLPFAVVMAAVAPFATQLAKRFGYRSVVSTGLLFLSASMFVVTRVDAHCSYWFVVVPTMALMAAGIALIQGPATDALMSTVPESSTGAASAVNDTIREIGGTLGVAVMGSAISSVYPDELSDSLSGLQIPSSIAKAAEDSVMAAKSILPHLPADRKSVV